MGNEILNGVVDKTDSGIILTLIVIAVILVVFGIPFYKILISYDREKRREQSEQQALTIQVIQQNTTVIARLEAIFTSSTNAQMETKVEYLKRFDDIEEAINLHNDKLVETHTLLKTKACMAIEDRKEE